MKSSAKKIELASVDDLFSTEEGRQDAKLEKIQEIPLSELHPFKNHPFKVKDDEAMMETADSIKQYGVLVPAIARPDPEGGYELVAGHRRHRASELAEKETMPVIVRDLDDDAATIIMVDSNLQRESLLPSERAFAYKMKLNAMKHQGERVDLTCSQVGNKLEGKKSSEVLAEQVGQSKNQIFRYIRLTELIPELMDMVDEKKIALNPAYELSFLKKEEQTDLLDAMDSTDSLPKTILFNLNDKDNTVLATMLGNFQSTEAASKIQYGPAWWFLDTMDGMTAQLKSLGNLGVLGKFVGMETDSRSFTSYGRHAYFRRILCALIGRWVEQGWYANDDAVLKEIVQGISYNNAIAYFDFA